MPVPEEKKIKIKKVLTGIIRRISEFRVPRNAQERARGGIGQVTIELTNRCNAQCVFCERWNVKPGDVKKELGTEEWKKVIGDCARARVQKIGFSGGEPFLRRDIFELIGEAKEKGMAVHINTNGYFLSEHAERIAGLHVDSVMVSIDSVDPARHDEIRKAPGLWPRAVAGVKKLKSLGVNVAIGAVLSRENLDEVRDYIAFSKGLGVRCRFQPVHDDLHDLRVANKKILFSEQDRKALQLATDLIRRESPGWVHDVYYSMTPLFLTHPQRFLEMKCHVAASSIYFINPFGHVFPCESRRDLGIGNVRENPFGRIVKSAETRKTRKFLGSDRRDCVCWYRCTAPGNISNQFAGRLSEAERREKWGLKREVMMAGLGVTGRGPAGTGG